MELSKAFEPYMDLVMLSQPPFLYEKPVHCDSPLFIKVIGGGRPGYQWKLKLKRKLLPLNFLHIWKFYGHKLKIVKIFIFSRDRALKLALGAIFGLILANF